MQFAHNMGLNGWKGWKYIKDKQQFPSQELNHIKNMKNLEKRHFLNIEMSILSI